MGCEIIVRTVRQQVKGADLVFRGTIEQLTEREVVFKVARVWKGPVSDKITLPKIESGSPCMRGFYGNHLWVGNELLVYASRIPELNVQGYVPDSARLARDAEVDLKKLGKGRAPKAR